MSFSPDILAAVTEHLDLNYNLLSRIHKLNTNIGEKTNMYIKREDELSSGISGSKLRKFTSLIKHVKEHSFNEVVVIGGSQSNNVTGVLQLLNEHNIKAKLFLLENKSTQPAGNALWTSLLYDIKEVVWVSHAEWPNVEKKADAYAKDKEAEGQKVFVLNEGGTVVQALPGAATLAFDIARNQFESELVFDHIFIDSGTGTSAIGVLLGISMLPAIEAEIHITLIAGNEAEFLNRYRLFQNECVKTYHWQTKMLESRMHFHRPPVAASFGAVNGTVLDEIKSIARSEGILMEPIYSIKHFLTAKAVIENKKLRGNILFIYNGGSFGLSGFQQMLAERV